LKIVGSKLWNRKYVGWSYLKYARCAFNQLPVSYFCHAVILLFVMIVARRLQFACIASWWFAKKCILLDAGIYDFAFSCLFSVSCALSMQQIDVVKLLPFKAGASA